VRQILCVRFLNWPMDWVARELPGRDSPGGEGPWAIVATAANQRPIVAANVAAAARGVERGMTLTQAQAICSTLAHREYDPVRDAKALTALARWMMRFSPLVCPTFDDHSIFLDVTGCGRVFGGLDQILRQVSGTMRRWRLTARSAIAPNPGAAWALAQFRVSNHIIIEQRDPHPGPPPEYQERGEEGVYQTADLAVVLAPFPVTALRIDSECAKDMRHLGIETIGQLAALPRSALPARFGRQLLLRLDQAMGRVPEPLDFLEHQSPVRVREDFEGVISAAESLRAVLEKLIDRIILELTDLGSGARRMEVDFFRPYAPAIHRTIVLSRPTRDGKKILRLIQCAMEGMGEEEKARRHGGLRQAQSRRTEARRGTRGERAYCLFPLAGFVGIQLEAAVVERITDEQFHLLEQADRTGQIELDDLIERLTLRLGPTGLIRPQLVESHVPEKAVRAVPEINRMLQPAAGKASVSPPALTSAARPLQLLPVPAPIRVIATLSSDGDGRPASFIHDGVDRSIVHATGPERISGQWWEGQNKTRDYFDVEDAEGRRFWIFRVMETTKWFLQGEWG
jgi:protein ImuB